MEPTDKTTSQSANVGNASETDLSRVTGPSTGVFPLAGKPILRNIAWESANLKGTSQQQGLVEGTARILALDWKWDKNEFANYPTSLEEQLERLHRGHEDLSAQLNEMKNARPESGEMLAPVLTQLKEICEEAERYLKERFHETNPHTAESVVFKVGDKYVNGLIALGAETQKGQASELSQHITFFQRSIAKPGVPLPKAVIGPGTVLVAETMTPLFLENVVPWKNIVGFISGGGAPHASQEATSYGWVGLCDVEGLEKKIRDGELANDTPVYMDGTRGSIWLNPSSEWIARFYQEREARIAENVLRSILTKIAVTRDGRPVVMSASIRRCEELENIEKVWPAGTGDIGLFRSEGLFGGENAPSRRKVVDQEDLQYEEYRQIVNSPHTDTPIIRLFDWGGEKTETKYTTDGSQMRDRGIRHSLLDEETRARLRVQLRALLRASEDGPVNILVPMVTDVEEIDEVHKEIQRSREELAERGIFPPVENASLGVMIEVGAAVGIIHDILQHVDFVNIGSGDLTQYVTGVERGFTAGGNPNWIKRFGPHHPAVIKYMYEIIDAAHTHGKKVHGCGDAFEDPRLAPILLGLDLDSISVCPYKASGMYQEIAGLDYAACKAFVGWAMLESGGRARAVFDELDRFHECVSKGELWEPPRVEPLEPEPLVIRV